MEKNDWINVAINAIRVVTFVCDIITFPVYLAVQQPWKRQRLSKRIKVSDFFFFLIKILALCYFKFQMQMNLRFYSSYLKKSVFIS